MSAAQRSLWPAHATAAPAEACRPRGVFADPGYRHRLWISIFFNYLPIEIHFNSNNSDTTPRALLSQDEGRPRVLLGNEAAARLGVRPGQTVQTALALAPELELAERDPDAEARALRTLATRCLRFTPAVSLDAPGALLLDVRASLRCFGGLDRLQGLLREDLAACGHAFQLACAPTALAALWLARSGRERRVRDCAELPGRLGDLPIESLRWPADVTRLLAGIGVATVGECIRLPRDGLARRIGAGRLAELDQAFGARPELREFHRPPRRFEASLDLPAETTDAGLLLVALQELLTRLDGFLRRHQGGAQVLWIALCHAGRPATVERVGLLRPSRDSGYLLELARIRFAELALDAPVVALALQTMLTKPPPAADHDLLGDARRGGDAVALVEQLRMRLGASSVHGIRRVPEHRPEAAWQPVAFSAVAPRRQKAEAPGAAPEFGYAPPARRPVWVLREPRPLRCMDGRPVFGHELSLEDGPERIETGWWDGHDVRRDYYVARDRSGTRLWVFRDHGRDSGEHTGRQARWYLHGLFG